MSLFSSSEGKQKENLIKSKKELRNDVLSRTKSHMTQFHLNFILETKKSISGSQKTRS